MSYRSGSTLSSKHVCLFFCYNLFCETLRHGEGEGGRAPSLGIIKSVGGEEKLS